MTVSREVQFLTKVKRPVWFMFSGLGSQWAGMGSMLMRIPVFAAAIERYVFKYSVCNTVKLHAD